MVALECDWSLWEFLVPSLCQGRCRGALGSP